MPVRNVVRYQAPDTYYHVYNRGHNKDVLFLDDHDYWFFLFLLQRSFGPSQLQNAEGRLYPWHGDKVRIQAFCLMPNHYHLLLYQYKDQLALSKAMQSLATTYSMYFNKKYQKRGSVFESTFKAAPILSDSYLQHITRYIHLNPKEYTQWPHSSYKSYIGESGYSWVECNNILDLFDSQKEYIHFVDDYTKLRDELADLKHALADHGETFTY